MSEEYSEDLPLGHIFYRDVIIHPVEVKVACLRADDVIVHIDPRFYTVPGSPGFEELHDEDE